MKKIIIILAVFAALLTTTYIATKKPVVMIDKDDDFDECATAFRSNMVERLNDELIITINGISIEEFGYDCYVSDEMELVVESDLLRSLLNCSVCEYPNNKVLIMKGDNSIELACGSDECIVNSSLTIDMKTKVLQDEETEQLYIPVDEVAKYLDYEVDYYFYDNHIDMALTGP
ncbi:MAG: hypothetical protein IJ167_10760 [Lachnospiraceae bacterium]|nr:hypothetical protein [Lachnospiraceae bacterium]